MREKTALKGWGILLVTTMLLTGVVMGAPVYLVKGGVAGSRIVVAAEAPRMVNLAAVELRDYLFRMTGADVPIVNEPGGDGEVAIYVGRSAYTDALGVTDEGLDYGAFRIVSGPDYLVLLGQDFDYEPLGITQEGWQEMTGSGWRNPSSERGQFNSELGIWSYDEGGSLYAVYEFLRGLGVRWFMPGELGEVIPQLASIELPAVDKTVRPDYRLRFWIWSGNRFSNFAKDDVLYDRRVGAGARYEVLGSTQLTHGIRNVLASEAMRRDHPEYYALIGTERDTFTRGTGHACFSSAGLAEEVANYARAVFDHLGVQLVQLSPQDGFRQCECEDCRDMSPSENVFGFLNRVAADVYTTHPDQVILAAGYGSYRQPPESIDTFSPNLAVTINNMGRPLFISDGHWQNYQDLVAGWQQKVGSNRILRVENTLYGAAPIPFVHPRSIARDLRAMQGISMGERNELRVNRDLPASTHLNRYVMGRYYWDADQDIEALLDDYYQTFYGPAGGRMRAAFDFAEMHPFGRSTILEKEGWHATQLDILKNQLAFWQKVGAAREVAGDTIYGQRIDLLLSEAPATVTAIQAKLKQLTEGGDPRAAAPVAVAANAAADGEPRTYRMVDPVSGETPPVETTFTLTWDGNDLIVDVLCQEPDMEKLQSSRGVHLGDSVAIMLETPFHAHYHIEVNPDGEVYDRIWGTEEAEKWASQAIVETTAGSDYWRARVRIPIINPQEGQGDPLHFVVGNPPTQEHPWYFNVGRVRIRTDRKETFLFSPTGGGNFHQPARFARLVLE